MSTLNDIDLTQASKDFVDCVVNPFESDRPGLIPDMNTSNTLSFRDNVQFQSYLNNFNFTADGVFTDTGCSSICIWFRYNYSHFNEYRDTSLEQYIYSIIVFGLSPDGKILFISSDGTSSGYPIVGVIPTQNYEIINGTISGTTHWFDISTSLVQSSRLVSAGLRLLSTVEQVTDTSQNYVSYFTCSQISSNELSACADNDYNLLNLLRNKQHTMINSNNEGCMSRYNPFQTNEQDNILPLQNCNSTSYRTDDILFPIVVATFKDAISNEGLFPVILNAQIWLECALKQPTPLYSQPSPVDPLYLQLRSVMSNSESVFPLVAKGHTFPRFSTKAAHFLKHVLSKHRPVAHLFRTTTRKLPKPIRKIIRKLPRQALGRLKNNRKKRRRQSNGRGMPGRKPIMNKMKIVRNF